MRSSQLFLVATFLLAASAFPVFSGTNPSEDLRAAFATFPSGEFPREIANLIAKQKDSERAVKILREAVIYNPAAAVATVGAAARVMPDLAAKFATTATRLQPQLAPGFGRAAAAAAPAHMAEVAAALAQEQPGQFARIAYEVAYAVPGQDQRIVDAVVSAVPNLKVFTAGTKGTKTALVASNEGTAVGQSAPQSITLSRPLTELIATAPIVESTAREIGIKADELLVNTLSPTQAATVTAKVKAAKISATASVNGSSKGVPFIPGDGTPGETNRAQNIVVTPGSGRNYSSPTQAPRAGD